MAILRIDMPQDSPQFVQQTQLDGETYTFRFHWNEREEAWYLQIGDVDDVPIISSRKLVANWPLLMRVTDSRRPPGELYLVDPTGSDTDPGLKELSNRVELLYFDEEEMELYR